MVRAQLLNKFTVARTATIRDHDAIDRRIGRADPFHANSNCHKILKSFFGATATLHPGRKHVPRKRGQTLCVEHGVGKPEFADL
jgi:hypothetical protein